MRPLQWTPPIELSEAEQTVVQRIRKAKLFVFARNVRHDLFDSEFQQELAHIFKDSNVGKCPVAPAQIALAIILQAYTGVSDDEVIEAMVMDKRWHLALDCLECEQAPFGKGTLVRCRAGLIAGEGDRRLIERTVEMAHVHQGFSARTLRAALDSSPLWGAARVEDTYNLLGHALRKALSVIAGEQQQHITDIATQAGAPMVAASSLKAALDLDWDDPVAKVEALTTILSALNEVESWVQQQTTLAATTMNKATESLTVGRHIEAQDVEVADDGRPKLTQGTAKDRRISIEEEQMRHGRKSRSKRFDGYKRHVLKDLDIGLVRAVGLTPANAPEATVTPHIDADLQRQHVSLEELHIDRAYLSSHWVKDRSDPLMIICKAWPVRKGERFDKTAFMLDWEQHWIRCPNGVSIPFAEGKVVRFPEDTCQQCPLQVKCTTSKTGRSVSIHPDASLLQELRQRQATPLGRAKLRERVSVEHSLAHVGQWQGDRARYMGDRKNLFDLRRMAVVHNLHVLARMSENTVSAVA